MHTPAAEHYLLDRCDVKLQCACFAGALMGCSSLAVMTNSLLLQQTFSDQHASD